MIRVILKGRTGNNMFQYAVGRYLSIKNEEDFVLDASYYFSDDQMPQVNQLKSFPIKCELIRKNRFFKRILRKANLESLWCKLRGIKHYKEHAEGVDVDESFFDLKGGVLVEGYFDKLAYVEPIVDVLQEELSFEMIELSEKAKTLKSEMVNSNSISIHIRAGDYLNIKSTQCVDAEYYKEAVALMDSRVKDPKFYVFSDDLGYAKKLLGSENYNFVDIEESRTNHLIDMGLMSTCKHNIITNSTYSWWAAFLNKNSEKVVVLPKEWSVGYESKTRAMKNWVRL